MIYRIFPTKDTFITNYIRNNTRCSSSNFGSSEVLEVFKVAPVSGASGLYGSSSLARSLMQFNIAEIAALTASSAAPSTGLTYRLKLKDCSHCKTLPYSYSIDVVTISENWDEGRGVDIDNFSDKGYCNWDKRSSNLWWTAAGGTTSSIDSASFYFDDGHEDLDVNVTTIVNSWLTGGLTNNGFMIRLSSTYEDDSTDYYVKMFHSRESYERDHRPCLEVSWDDSIKDDRNNFIFDYPCNLYLYNKVRGELKNIPGIGTGNLYVAIKDLSGTLTTLTASHIGTAGIYSASFTLSSASYSGSRFSDVWFSGSVSYMTGTFYPTSGFASASNDQNKYYVNVTNLKNEYENDEVVRLKLFVRNKNYNPAVVQTASADVYGDIITKGYYRIMNDRTDEIIMQFGTGSVETTRLSYDKNGNYFKLYMSSFDAGNVYRISFLFDVDGQRQLIDEGFKFKVK